MTDGEPAETDVRDPQYLRMDAKKSVEEGPENTQFDFFDPAGLEVAGEWTASRSPIRKKEEAFPKLKLTQFQSNHEGALIDKLHEIGFSHHGIVLNAGGYTHTSVALADAVAAIATPVVEVHLSNLAAREDFRQKSLLGRHCAGCVSGFGLESYRLAVQWFVNQQPKRMGFKSRV